MAGPVFWSDVSEFQVPVDDSYPYPVLAIRSNDGTYRDKHFAANYAWGRKALAGGKLRILIVYCVWRPNWAQTADIHTSMIGDPAPAGVVSMLDVESWGGQITGNQSAGINAARDRIAASSYGGDHRRVIGYGNSGDLASLWPGRAADQRLIVAAYGSNPTVAGEIGHQFTDGQYGGPITVPPFGRDDVNESHGLTLDALAAAVGLGATSRPPEDAMMLPPIPLPPSTDPSNDWVAKRFWTDTVGAPGQCIGREWLILGVDGPDGATAEVNVFPQHTGGGTGPEHTMHASVLTDGSHTCATDEMQLPQGTTQAQLQWKVSPGATGYLIPAFTPAGQ